MQPPGTHPPHRAHVSLTDARHRQHLRCLRSCNGNRFPTSCPGTPRLNHGTSNLAHALRKHCEWWQCPLPATPCLSGNAVVAAEHCERGPPSLARTQTPTPVNHTGWIRSLCRVAAAPFAMHQYAFACGMADVWSFQRELAQAVALASLPQTEQSEFKRSHGMAPPRIPCRCPVQPVNLCMGSRKSLPCRCDGTPSSCAATASTTDTE